MNFIRDTFQTDKRKRKVSLKDINFFQTVREGTRKYGKKKDIVGAKSSSSGSIVGRTFIRPQRTQASPDLGSFKLSVHSILEERLGSWPPPSTSTNEINDGSGFFNSGAGFSSTKRAKTIPFWEPRETQEIPHLPSVPNFAQTNIERQKTQKESPEEENCSIVLSPGGLEERGCNGDDKNKVSRLLDSPRIPLSPPFPMFGDPLSSCSTPRLNEENRPGLSPFKGVTPSAQASSCSRPPFAPAASSYNGSRPFPNFPAGTPGVSGSSSKKDSFFKIPEQPVGSISDNYDSLFSTPRPVNTLPHITTPQLFIPYQKPTPKTTPQTKSSVRTPHSSSQDSFYVISLTEGRGHAMCEVGLAAVDLTHPVLLLSQFSDSQTYKKTLAKINIIDPAEMLVPDTFREQTTSVLFKTVTETFPEMRVMTVKRQHYSAKQGLDTIRSLLLPEATNLELVIHRKYYTLAAAEALMKYIEIKHGKLFAPKSLKVNYESAKDIVAMDLESCQRLELVMSNAEMVFPEKYSLFGLLNHTKTLGGKRRLRVSLLQPSSSIDILRQRQNTVAALIENQRSLAALQTNLLRFSNVERLLWLCLKSPNFKNEAKTFETLTNYILLLKASLEGIPHLLKVLQDIDDDYIINIRDELSDNRYEEILARILKMIQEDARPAKGYAEAERQRCFAIKEGINDLLDVARATHSDLIQQVMDNISDLAREHGLPLRMAHSPDLGFHPAYLLPKKSQFDKDDLPEIFTEVKLKNRTVHCLTDEICAYNMRIKRALQEIQLITNVVIYDLVESLRNEISLLYRLCDHISELDFLTCIAQVSSTPDYTRPVFSEETSLIGARHPILDHVRPNKPIPNNVYCSTKKNFNIITGPNMGGKTVYVLMIPLIQIMAQIGCYVPADKAEIRITQHIYVKKGTPDSIECKVSSYTKEIRELAYSISNITDSSLIILDEICTGTLSDQGTAIAWAFCEEFLKRPAFTFLATHYHYLTNLSKIYQNVTNWNMEAIECPSDKSEYSGLTFTYRLLQGVTNATNYALRLMMSSGLPDRVKKNAVKIIEDLVKKRAASLPLVIPETPTTAGLHSKIDKLEQFMTNLYGLSMTDNFTEDIISTLQKMAMEEILSEDDDDESLRSYDTGREEHHGMNHEHISASAGNLEQTKTCESPISGRPHTFSFDENHISRSSSGVCANQNISSSLNRSFLSSPAQNVAKTGITSGTSHRISLSASSPASHHSSEEPVRKQTYSHSINEGMNRTHKTDIYAHSVSSETEVLTIEQKQSPGLSTSAPQSCNFLLDSSNSSCSDLDKGIHLPPRSDLPKQTRNLDRSVRTFSLPDLPRSHLQGTSQKTAISPRHSTDPMYYGVEQTSSKHISGHSASHSISFACTHNSPMSVEESFVIPHSPYKTPNRDNLSNRSEVYTPSIHEQERPILSHKTEVQKSLFRSSSESSLYASPTYSPRCNPGPSHHSAISAGPASSSRRFEINMPGSPQNPLSDTSTFFTAPSVISLSSGISGVHPLKPGRSSSLFAPGSTLSSLRTYCGPKAPYGFQEHRDTMKPGKAGSYPSSHILSYPSSRSPSSSDEE